MNQTKALGTLVDQSLTSGVATKADIAEVKAEDVDSWTGDQVSDGGVRISFVISNHALGKARVSTVDLIKEDSENA